MSEQSVFLFSCTTCRASFASTELIKDHYRSDWHIFSSKRRANGLAPITQEEYKSIAPKNKIQSNSVVVPKKAASVVSSESRKEATKLPNPTAKVDQLRHAAVQLGLPSDRIDIVVDLAALQISQPVTITDDDDDDADWEDVEDEEILINANISIFDDVVFETTEECVAYMELNFGFFIPDREFLTDIDGFLKYLGEKVKLGGLCIYCQKQFSPGRPCQNHMISKSHCKIAYEEGIDIHEFEDFFDYSSTYDDDDEQQLDEDGNVMDDSLLVSSTGELMLPNGRVVGHREFKKYYKQKFRPEDNRPSVLSQKREELLKLGNHFVGLELSLSSTQLQKLSDSEVMAMIIKKRKEIRKMQNIDQRAQQKYNFINRRSEYASTVDKLRSSATTTEKIRDWHKTV